ncbi:hypothetical protein XELAEV_18023352mg [Xenopus laevis]|uniref:Uncharacterized protein n=1 Tax=Xenopus laevis TaxID=8355 RepID=A0A974HP08_XENLA|nr:hypothetical protein XELAEV_18023352mg [Xenopus laevis]
MNIKQAVICRQWWPRNPGHIAQCSPGLSRLRYSPGLSYPRSFSSARAQPEQHQSAREKEQPPALRSEEAAAVCFLAREMCLLLLLLTRCTCSGGEGLSCDCIITSCISQPSSRRPVLYSQ